MLQAAFQRSEQIFALLPEEALLERPITQRHPLLFYVGHLPAFAWNQIGRGALGLGHLDRDLDLLFARGIDPADDAAAEAVSIRDWPTLGEVLAYRDAAQEAVLAQVPAVLARASEDPLCARGRILHLVVEHELMHHETLMYMLQECPPGVLRRPPGAISLMDGDGRAAEPRLIAAGSIRLGVDFEDLDFGWDNEFGRLIEHVPAFTIDSLPVRNRDYLEFLHRQSGRERQSLWPRAWLDPPGRPSEILVKTVLGPVPLPLAAGWPVQVSARQARLYCAAHGGRLPTEAELHRAAFTTPDDDGDAPGKRPGRPYPWGSAAPRPEHGNLGFQHHAPVPVGTYPASASAWGVEELVGNGWEWTGTPFGPLPGFVPYARTYPGYSQDFFDGEHDVVFGGSWATDTKLLRPSFRNWYRTDYPYVFSSFRVVRSAPDKGAR